MTAVTCGRTGVLATAALLAALAGPRAARGAEVLNKGTCFRLQFGWKTPVVLTASGKMVPLREKKRRGLKDADRKPVKVVQSPPLPAGWIRRDFDDRPWGRDLLPARFPQATRATVHVPGNPMEWCVLAARGKFHVAHPA